MNTETFLVSIQSSNRKKDSLSAIYILWISKIKKLIKQNFLEQNEIRRSSEKNINRTGTILLMLSIL